MTNDNVMLFIPKLNLITRIYHDAKGDFVRIPHKCYIEVEEEEKRGEGYHFE